MLTWLGSELFLPPGQERVRVLICVASILDSLIENHDKNHAINGNGVPAEEPEQPNGQHSQPSSQQKGLLPTTHRSPSKLRHDHQRQELHDNKVRSYVENEKLFLEATAYRDNVPDSPGRGDVVALFDSPGLDVNRGDVMRNSRRRQLHPSFKKYVRTTEFELMTNENRAI